MRRAAVNAAQATAGIKSRSLGRECLNCSTVGSSTRYGASSREQCEPGPGHRRALEPCPAGRNRFDESHLAHARRFGLLPSGAEDRRAPFGGRLVAFECELSLFGCLSRRELSAPEPGERRRVCLDDQVR